MIGFRTATALGAAAFVGGSIFAAIPAGAEMLPHHSHTVASTTSFGSERSAAAPYVFDLLGQRTANGVMTAYQYTPNDPGVQFQKVNAGHGKVRFEYGNSGFCVSAPGIAKPDPITVRPCNTLGWQQFREGSRGTLQDVQTGEFVQYNGFLKQLTGVQPADRQRDQDWSWVTGSSRGRGTGNGHPVGGQFNGAATASTKVINDPDSGHGNPAVWAHDDFTRTVSVKRTGTASLSNCGIGAATCYAYTASLHDVGSFTTVPGAGAPNQAAPYTGKVEKSPARTGDLDGQYAITFYASSATPKASLVANFHNDGGVAASGEFTSTNWVEQFFPAGTTFGTGPNGGAYKWVYTLSNPAQRWVDSSSNGDGNLSGDGEITG